MKPKTQLKPIEIELPFDGNHKGVLWAGLADRWEQGVKPRIVDGVFVTAVWIGRLINSSSN